MICELCKCINTCRQFYSQKQDKSFLKWAHWNAKFSFHQLTEINISGLRKYYGNKIQLTFYIHGIHHIKNITKNKMKNSKKFQELYLNMLHICNNSHSISVLSSSVAQSCRTFCDPDSLRPHESQHTRPLCPSPTPGVYPNTCPSSRWCHPAISSSVIHFSSCPQSLPASESFPMSQLFARGGQSIGVSALGSVLPMNTQDWSPLEWDWLDRLAVHGTLKSLLQDHSSKASFLRSSAFFTVQLSHPYMTTGKTIALTRWTFVGKVMSLFLNMLSKLVITFLPWLQSSSAVIVIAFTLY